MADDGNSAEMDEAARVAEIELENILNELDEIQKKGAKAVFRWAEKHYMKAGYKRLGKICVRSSKKYGS
jgi:hypothetical protein